MHGPLSFEAARGNCRSRSHAPPAIVFGLDGIPCEGMENGGIVLQHRNILPRKNVAILSRESVQKGPLQKSKGTRRMERGQYPASIGTFGELRKFRERSRVMAPQQIERWAISGGTAGDEEDIMIKDFNVSEKGHGSYWLLGILRWVMVLIFISFGIQKFTPQSADGIALYISNSPFVSWLSIFGIRGEAYLLGIIELTTAAILAAGAFIPLLSALGSLMGIGTFAITWSFFFSTPGVVKWSVSADPIAWNLTGEFLYKDVVLLCVCIVLFLASLPKKVVPLRSN